jgi:MFS family permease
MKDKLFTRSYVAILAANFLMFMGFYLLLPILPFYLSESYGIDKAMIGTALSCYVVAALCIRPFAGYLLDTFARKPLYLLAYGVFTIVFASYILAGVLVMFIVLRILHGASFGVVTVAGNTIVIDVMPSSRRGEGLGYYGMANNFAMSVGPMLGLFMHDHFSFEFIFLCSFCSCILGFVCASSVKTRVRPPEQRKPISLDRFILLRGIPGGVALMLLSIPYGITTTYIAMYSKELGLSVSSGLFFTLMAVGIASSRVFSGKLVDKGYLTVLIRWSKLMAVVVFFSLGLCKSLSGITDVSWLFMGCALFMGISFGTMFPAYNTLFVNLAPNSERGTAVSTYLTSWDVGVGTGLLVGGMVSEYLGFDIAYFIGAGLSLAAWAWFKWYVSPRYMRDRVRK